MWRKNVLLKNCLFDSFCWDVVEIVELFASLFCFSLVRFFVYFFPLCFLKNSYVLRWYESQCMVCIAYNAIPYVYIVQHWSVLWVLYELCGLIVEHTALRHIIHIEHKNKNQAKKATNMHCRARDGLCSGIQFAISQVHCVLRCHSDNNK